MQTRKNKWGTSSCLTITYMLIYVITKYLYSEAYYNTIQGRMQLFLWGGAWEWGESIGQPHLGWGWPKKISQLYLLCAPGFGTLSQMKCFLIYLKFVNKSIFIIQKKYILKIFGEFYVRVHVCTVHAQRLPSLHAIDIEAYNWIFFSWFCDYHNFF